MNKKHLLLPLLLAFVIGIGNVWAETYNLVTDANDLSDGDKILIVSPAGSVKSSGTTYNYSAQALTSTASSTRLAGSTVTISSNTITSTNAEEFTLSKSTDSWKIYSGTKYLTATAKKQLATGAENSALAFSISIEGTAATISCVVGSDNVKLQLNATVSNSKVNTYFAL